MSALPRLDAAIRAAGIPIDGVSGSQGSTRVDYQASATAAQRTQGAAIVAAFDWSAAADATWQAQQEKAAATAQIDNGALKAGISTERLVRALALVVLDEVNVLRAASVPVLAPRTAAQLVTAIKAKIAATAE
jgi:hypothetical protein